MSRLPREFKPEAFELEGRLLLATLTASTPSSSPDASKLPLKVVGITAVPGGGVLRFNQPVDPAWAANVKNYTVSLETYRYFGNPLQALFNIGRHVPVVTPVRLQSVEYDPATQSVALFPKQQRLAVFFGPLKGLKGSDPPYYATTSVRPGHQLSAAQDHTEVQGGPINVHTTPEKVELRMIENPNPPNIYD